MNLNKNTYEADSVAFAVSCNTTGKTRSTRDLYQMIRRGVIEGMEVENPIEIANVLDQMITELNGFYGEDWDFVLVPTGDPSKFNLVCLIHFPEITIKNSGREEHTITDLFVNFRLSVRDDRMTITDFKGFRSSNTTLERNVGYIHSHLPSYSMREFANFRGKEFCLGDTEMNSSSIDMMANFDIDKFSLFLFTIGSFVRWESTEGIPYLYMRNIPSTLGGRNFYNVGTSSYNQVYRNVIETLRGKPMVFSTYGDRLKLTEDSLTNTLRDLLIEQNSIGNLEICFVRDSHVPGRYLKYNPNLDPNQRDHTLIPEQFQGAYFYFRGRKIEPIITDPLANSDGSTTNSISDYKLHPSVIKYFKDEIEKEVYEKSVNYTSKQTGYRNLHTTAS